MNLEREAKKKGKSGRQWKVVLQSGRMETAQQIKGFFSRYNSKLRQMRVGELTGDQDDDGVTEEDMEALDVEFENQDLCVAVYSDINRPDHPIEAGEFNICQLIEDHKLNKLKLLELKSIFDALQLNVEGSQARKKSFLGPLEEFAKSCTCQK